MLAKRLYSQKTINVGIQPLLQKGWWGQKQPPHLLRLGGPCANRVELKEKPKFADQPFKGDEL
eukprot:5853749-Pyramimonas_sp.AAC.1